MDNLELPIKTYLSELNQHFKDNKIKKRDGKIQKFDIFKILTAIHKSFEGKECHYTSANITYEVCHALLHSPKYDSQITFELEHVQDVIEKILMRNYPCVAKKFIIYREQRRKVRDDKKAFDVSSIINGYIKSLDWRVKENSNIGYSIGALILHNSGAMSSHYWLDEIYPKEVKEAHLKGAVHLHDISTLSGYCMGLSLRKLIEEGIPGLNGNLASYPAKHLSTVVNQMVNFLGIHQNEVAGAVAFSSVDTWLAPFVRWEGLEHKRVKQNLQSLIFGVNTPSRWGSQAMFTNFTFDIKPPADLKDKPVVIGGKWWKKDNTLVEMNSIAFDDESLWKYAYFQEEMDMINKAFLELMYDGDADGRPFSYPIPTYNITKDFEWDSPVSNLLFKMAGKYGLPYFQNFLNSDLDPSAVRSMCCRLQLDKSVLLKRGGGLFGADEFTGSMGVATLNLPQIGYLLKKENEGVELPTKAIDVETIIEKFWEKVLAQMEIARTSLLLKKKTIERFTEMGLYPYTKHHIKHWNNHFLTIGLVGMNEALLNLMGLDITHPDARKVGLEILTRMRQQIIQYQLDDDADGKNNLWNLEATPAEGTSHRLAKIDKKNYPDIITAGEGADIYYTNSTIPPVGYTDDIWEVLDHQDAFQTKYTGGTVLHLFVGESLDADAAKLVVRKVCENYHLPYISLTPTYSVCKVHGHLSGRHPICPKCGEDCDVYSRVVGYYRPVSNWNKGKKQEFKERKTYVVEEAQ